MNNSLHLIKLYWNYRKNLYWSLIKYISSHILELGDDIDWKSFGDNLVVSEEDEGTEIDHVIVNSVDECKRKCNQNDKCRNVQICEYGGISNACFLYEGRLTGDERTHSDDECTQYYKKANRGNYTEVC